MKKLFRLVPLLLTGALVAPIATSLSSCSLNMSSNLKFIDFESLMDTEEPAHYSDFSSPNVGLRKLLYGDKNFNHGNYVLMLGSAYINESQDKGPLAYRMLTSDVPSSTYDVDHFSISEGSGVLGAAYSAVYDISKTDWKLPSPLKFITVLDNFKAKTDEEKTVFSPLAKWTEQDEDEDSSHKEGHYKRNDKGAKIYREVAHDISTLFNFDTDFDMNDENTPNYPYLIFWKDGIPKKALKIDDGNCYADTLSSPTSGVLYDIYKSTDSDK